MTSHNTNRRNLLWRLCQEAWPCRAHIAGLLALSLLSPPLALMVPLPLKLTVDNLLGGRPLPRLLDAVLPAGITHSQTGLLLVIISLVLAVGILTQLRDFVSALLTTYTGEKLLRAFRAKLFRHAQRLSLAYHDTRGTSDSTYRIQYDATALQNIVVEGAAPLVTSSVTLLAMIAVMARINWKLALVGLAICPVIFILSRANRRRMRKQSREVKQLESSALSVIQEVLGAVRVVKAFGQEEREQDRFVDRSNEGMRARLQLAVIEGGFGMVVALVTAAGMAAVLYLGIKDIQAGHLTLGNLLLVMGYLAQLYAPLKTMSRKMSSLQSHMAGAERAFALLDESPDVIERTDARPLIRAAGAVSFRQVCFAYNAERPILRDVSFDIPAGTCVGIAGTTGAGKSTLVNLLTRFYDPTSGVILLDGRDLRDYRLADLRNQFALVLQEPILFSVSIGENIAYARPEATEQEIIAAAKAANAHDFITRMPQGYGTLVGERGLCLSGGERQRISIARAFLKQAPILIMDEPTSSVDIKTETVIVEAMERLIDGRTSFIIAHRPSTLSHCDLLLKIEHGRLVQLESKTLTHSLPSLANA
ncbi:MAG TPA: ABC transporter ATP-binding protein [Candidatus Limnocylindrales bacterium]|nr:ABC transporter ATP-binding protein [Candidatus Limnocylindrales bacterium]